MTPQTYADLAHENMLLLAALWRHVMVYGTHSEEWLCRECWSHGPDKAAVKHHPGCALFGVDPSILAQMDEFDRMPERV